MPIDIRMKPGFMYLGSTPEAVGEAEVPVPSGKPFATSYRWQTQDSADGAIVGQQLGRSRSAQEMTWGRMDCETWWRLNRWIEQNGMSFYARYFNFNLGEWQTRRFYTEGASCSPVRPGQKSGAHPGVPLYLENCTLSVYDMGEVET